VLEWAQPAAVVGLVPQLGAGVVEGQDPQEVRVKGSEVAGDLEVERRGWPRGVKQQQCCRLQVPWRKREWKRKDRVKTRKREWKWEKERENKKERVKTRKREWKRERERVKTRKREWKRQRESKNEEETVKTRKRQWKRGSESKNEEERVKTRKREWKRGRENENEEERILSTCGLFCTFLGPLGGAKIP
jgi:hypothetical protein